MTCKSKTKSKKNLSAKKFTKSTCCYHKFLQILVIKEKPQRFITIDIN